MAWETIAEIDQIARWIGPAPLSLENSELSSGIFAERKK